MVTPRSHRALALALAVLLMPLAAAQVPTPTAPDPRERPESPTTPQQAECTQPVETCLPDVMPTNPRASASDERYPVTACTDFINVGDAPTTALFRVRLDVDDIPTGERSFSKIYQRGEGEANICWGNLTLVAGRHRMTITVDSSSEMPESNENNNQRSTTFTVGPTPKVDLRLSHLDVTPRLGAAKQNQVFLVNVTNVGTAASVATTVNLTDTNGKLATFDVRPLAPRETASFAHVTRPEYRPVGTFIAQAVVDPLGLNAEINELDNDMYVEYTVLDHPAPDLIIESLTITGNHTQYRGLKAHITVRNIGDQLARSIVIGVMNEGGTRLGEASSVGVLYPNQTTVVQLNLMLLAGNRTIRFFADPYNVVLERNETNNRWSEDIVVVLPSIEIDAPNLIIERMYAMPSDPRPGEAVSVGALIRNVGTSRSNASVINFTVDGASLSTAPVPALAPDASYSAYVPWIVRAAGLYNISARADSTEKVFELGEDDNTLGLSFSVTSVRVPDPEETPPPTNTTKPPTNTTPPTPTTPTPPKTNTTKPPVITTPQRIVFGELTIDTRAVPGGVKGIVSASIRNPSIQPIATIEVTFKVDGTQVKQVLLQNLRGAASGSATTGEIDLPAGKHNLTTEVRIIGTTEIVSRSKDYEAVAGDKAGLPAPGIALLLPALVALALFSRRRLH